MTLALVEAERNTKNAMVRMPKAILIILMLLGSHQLFAQGVVELEVDERIMEELRMKNASVDTNKLQGYRIQIFFGSDMRQAQAAMGTFRARYPQYSDQVYQLYQQPSWKVRVGNFYREIEAQALLQDLLLHYPGAFVVRDEIELPPLPKNEVIELPHDEPRPDRP